MCNVPRGVAEEGGTEEEQEGKNEEEEEEVEKEAEAERGEKTLRVEESRAGRASRWKQAGWINFGATVPEADA